MNLRLIFFKDSLSQWSSWNFWSPCSQTCGGAGARTRYRVCLPSNSTMGNQNIVCSGDDLESENCSGLPCPLPHCPDGFEYSVG